MRISSCAEKKILLVVAIVVSLLAVSPAATAATPEPYQAGDYGGFRNILPPGQTGHANATDVANFFGQGAYPPHFVDQAAMYGDLVYNAPGLTAAEIGDFFKDASFGVRAGEEERVYSPPLRAGVVIVRDENFGVPHIYGDTRADVEYGLGYASAEDRLFFMDVLRHAGRAQLSGFAGVSNKAMDRDQWAFAPYNESDLQLQFDMADDVYGSEGAQLQQDVQNYVAGVNGYILEARINPLKMPAEYGAVGRPLEDWQVTDPLATASLIGGLLGKGGGNEVGSAEVLATAQKRFGRKVATGVWGDFRRAEDPEAPTTVRGTSFPYEVPRGIRPEAVAMPDAGSVVDAGPDSGASASAASSSQSSGTPVDLAVGAVRSLLAFPSANSNALLVSADKSESGRPVAVMGPQVAYFIPEVLMEVDAHCLGNCQGGPDIDAAGATFPGVSIYVLLGRGPDFAWSATSAGQDIIDTFAEELCEPDGSTPTINSTHYLYKDECLAMETLTRTNVITPNPADPCGVPDEEPCGPYTLESLRTIHGIVYKRGTVGGKPVAFVRQRSSYFHEADSALAFLQLNDPDRVRNAQDFQQAMYKMNLTFNWFYADDQDIAYFNSGNNPVRARGVDPNFPAWGSSGRWDWENFDPDLHTADFTPFSEHPQVVNQSYLTSWNNKQAPGYRAADDQFGYGSIYRSMPLDDRIEQQLANGGKLNLPELVDAMEDAGTVDLRGDKLLPLMLDVVGSPSDPALASAVNTLRAWADSGAHRRDADGDKHYEDATAIQLMDAWWPRAVEAQFKPELGPALFDSVKSMIGFDNEPNNHGDHLGSAYQGGWYGYVDKDLRQVLGLPVQGRFSRDYCGGGKLNKCRTALRDALQAALADTPATLYQDSGCTDANTLQWCFDAVRFRAIGAITHPPFHWINRPTFQQVVEIQGHRPR